MNKIVPTRSLTAAKLVGNAHEARFERIMNAATGFPSWYYGVRRATEDEDHRGVDFIAELDITEIPLQIKSSVAGRDKHIRHALKHCGTRGLPTKVILVPDCFTDDLIKTDTLRVLSLARERFYTSVDRFARGAR